jgi:hypothetical protein
MRAIKNPIFNFRGAVPTRLYIGVKWHLACHVTQTVPSLDFDLQMMIADYIVQVVHHGTLGTPQYYLPTLQVN